MNSIRTCGVNNRYRTLNCICIDNGDSISDKSISTNNDIVFGMNYVRHCTSGCSEFLLLKHRGMCYLKDLTMKSKDKHRNKRCIKDIKQYTMTIHIKDKNNARYYE